MQQRESIITSDTKARTKFYANLSLEREGIKKLHKTVLESVVRVGKIARDLI